MDEKTIIDCPHCRQRLSVPIEMGNLVVTCPKCRASWEWTNTWPTIGDYKEVIQEPRYCFIEPELQQGITAINAVRGSPLLWEGNFAVVFKVHNPFTRNTWAVKCFHRKVTDIKFRYRAISEHLQKVRTALPFTVDFQFVEKGIRVNGFWFPIIKMQWIEGISLNDFVRNNLDRPILLNKIADLILAMGKQLEKAQLAHGDLQHGNILIVDKNQKAARVKLVDYDGAYVSALAGLPPNEKGHANYQHRDRMRDCTYGDNIDRFPLIILYCAIRMIAEGGPSLWERFDNGDNLLFRESDLVEPGKSALLKEAWYRNDWRIKNLVGRLIIAINDPLTDVPSLSDFLNSAKKVTMSAADTKKIDDILNASDFPGNQPQIEVVHILCPHCGHEETMDLRVGTKVLSCPACDKLIINPARASTPIPMHDAPGGSIPRLRSPKQNEVIDFTCPNCRRLITLRPSDLGGTTRCFLGGKTRCFHCSWNIWVPCVIPEENLREVE